MEIAPNLLRTGVIDLKTDFVAVPCSAPLTKVIGTQRQKNAYEAFIVDDEGIDMMSIRGVPRAKSIHSRKASSLAVTYGKGRRGAGKVCKFAKNRMCIRPRATG